MFQNAIETRNDLLLYTSEPLDKPLFVTGPVRARLKVSINTPDTDVVLRILDVDTAGNALLVQEGALRLRYREGFVQPKPLIPGEVYQVTVDLRDIAYLFEAGHRLRLHVAGSSFPRLERNLNTGGPNFSETESRQAEISVHSDPANPSALIVHAYTD